MIYIFDKTSIQVVLFTLIRAGAAYFDLRFKSNPVLRVGSRALKFIASKQEANEPRYKLVNTSSALLQDVALLCIATNYGMP